VAIAHVEDDPAPPSAHVTDLSPAIDDIVLRCLAKDPAERFADGDDLAQALETFDVRAPVPIDAISGAERAWWAGRRALVGAALIVALAGGSVVSVLVSRQNRVAADTEDERRLPNVGGLKIKSPSPAEAAVAPRPTPTPSPSKEKKEEERAKDRGTSPDRDRGPDNEPKPEPEPTPEPTHEPDPEPTTQETAGP
jgi:outer membrane biosynthesis protein TonB